MNAENVISDTYRELNKQLHETQQFGGSSRKWADAMAALVLLANSRHFVERFEIKSVLDYGSGTGNLGKFMDKRFAQLGMEISISDYEPAIPEKSKMPKPADFVVCTDVMEHVEPELIYNVLNHIDGLAKVAAFFLISLQSSNDVLADGTPAHKTIKSYQWWVEKLKPMYWNIFPLPARKPHKVFAFIVLKKGYDEWKTLLQRTIEKH